MANRRAHSKVLKLPPRFRDAIRDALVKHGKTYDELAELVEQWVDAGEITPDQAPSRAGLARFGKSELARLEQVDHTREYAKAVIAKTDEYGMTLDEAAANMLLSELMTIIMKLTPGEQMDPADLARLMTGFGKLQQSSAAREKIKGELEKRIEEARKRAIAAARAEGLSEESAARVGEQVKIYIPDNQRSAPVAAQT
ncbi:MAG: phage protein Gp27 family protein [Pseudomonadota bacterium]